MNDRLELRCRMDHPGFRLDVDLGLPMRGVTGIFGTSGAGKTTLLRLVAGLERPTAGRISVGGATWHDAARAIDLPVNERGVGYVFQEPRLFAHMDVRGNLLYGSSRRGGGEVDFGHVIDLLGLAPLLDREPRALSGGEAQRVAIGRALLSAPRIILMDEPLASLDAARKEEILPFLDRLHGELETPILYVSHAIGEVCRLCDHLVVLECGRVVADGELQSVLLRLDVPQLAGIEAGAVIIGDVVGFDSAWELTHVRFAGGELRLPGRHGEPGTKLRLRIRANDVSLCTERPGQTTILNVLPGRVEAFEEAGGASQLLRIAIGESSLLARITRRSTDELGLAVGREVHVQIKAVAVREP